MEDSIYDRFLVQLQKEGCYLASEEEKWKLQAVMWDSEGHRTLETVARSAARIAEIAGFALPAGTKFIIVREDMIGKEHPFSVRSFRRCFRFSALKASRRR